MLPFSFIGAGTYTNPASLVNVQVPLSDKPDWFFVKDITNWGLQSGGKSVAAAPVYAEWFSGMSAGAALLLNQENIAAGSANLDTLALTAGGFTFVDPSNPPIFTGLVSTTINDVTFVVSMANTGSIAVGDLVRVVNPVNMLQIGGLVAQVTAVSVNTSITLGYVATGVAGLNVTGNATSSTIIKLIPQSFYPKTLKILNVTKATQAKVFFAQPNNFTPGELVDFTIPTTYGMSQLSFLTAQPGGAARVLVTTNTATESSITINVDTTGFTAFAYPATTSVVGTASPATCQPAGSGVVPLNGSATVPQSPPGTNLQDAFDNRNQFYMLIGTSACGIASATMQWMAFKADYSNLSNA